jgi:carbon-monoxide dehydrogenase medium subunit
MKPAPFHYHAPKTVNEAVALLAEVAPADGRVLAGGQSLVPTMAFRLARPGHLVDINGIAELDHIAVADGKLMIGACVRHAAFYRPVADGPLGRLLASVVRHIAHHPIRTRGTFCGSLVHADPASEWCLVAATLGAEMVAHSRRGARVIAAADFFAGIMTTALKEDELLTEARLPLLPPDTHFGFYEFSRRAGDFAIAMALATYRLKDGRMVEPRLGIGGAEPNPRRIREAERVVEGQKPGPDAFAAAAEAAAGAVEAMDDSNYSADYRRDLVRTVTFRALDQAASSKTPEGPHHESNR